MQYEPGHYYHAYNRGNNKRTLFYEETNYHYLIRLFEQNVKRFQVTLIAYCLMPNHYHLLLRQDNDIPLSRFIQSTFQSYAQAFNKRYHQSGKLFENPRDPKIIDDENYLFQVCRYIHRNPLDADLVKNLADWSYSNYPEFIGVRSDTLYPEELVTEWFPTPEGYRQFVEDDFDDQGYGKIGQYLFY